MILGGIDNSNIIDKLKKFGYKCDISNGDALKMKFYEAFLPQKMNDMILECTDFQCIEVTQDMQGVLNHW